MDWLESPLIVWLMVSIHVFGFIGLLAARVGEQSSNCLRCQCLFYASLILVGMATVCSLAVGTGYWIASATLISIMSVGATLDLRHDSKQAAW